MRAKRKISTVSSIFFVYLISIIIIFLLYQMDFVTSKINFSLVAAWVLNFANFCLALLLFRFSIRKSNKSFMIYNFGGMVARMFSMLTILILCIKSLKIDIYAFIFTFLVFYFMSLIGEILYFHKKQNMISTVK